MGTRVLRKDKWSPRRRRFRNAIATMVKDNRRIAHKVDSNRLFHDGNELLFPKRADRVDGMVNPHFNGCSAHVYEFFGAAEAYRPGEYPLHELEVLEDSIRDLIENHFENLLICAETNTSLTVVMYSLNYMRTPQEDFDPNGHHVRLCADAKRWLLSFSKGSDAFLVEAKRIYDEVKNKSLMLKTSAARGPKNTEMMESQRRAVIEYLEVELHRPASSVTDADVYHVWNLPENKASWDEAALRKDNLRGYVDVHSLCQAIKREVSK